MAYRRIMQLLTLLSALLMVGSLGLVVHSRGERAEQPARLELGRALAGTLDSLNDRVDTVSQVSDLASAREARQELARVVVTFDQDLLALAETAGDRRALAAVAEIQAIWRTLGLGLADLAAGEYAASSAAGREVVAQLKRELPALRQYLQAVTAALHGADQRTGRLGGMAATGAAILGGLTLLLGLAWARPPRAATAAAAAGSLTAPQRVTAAQMAESPANWSAARSSPKTAPDRPSSGSRPAAPFVAHGDLGLASAAVDRVTLDMSTIARSTERLEQAVASVASALQGMLFSLNEMAQDTFEGSRLTRTAHNAAIYAADTARELLETAREMADVVGRVRTLAARSQEIAERIETEAAASGATGEAFTSVVAEEVKQLATATSDATARIEATVETVLVGQRQYEEAIGQIIKNIGAVRKVAASLGELMLAPPLHVQPGAGYPVPAAVQPVAPAVAAPAAFAPAPANPAPIPAAPPAPALPSAAVPPAAAAADLSAAPPPAAEPEWPDPGETLKSAEELTAATASLLDELAEVAAETNAVAAAEKPAAAAEPQKPAAPEPQTAPRAENQPSAPPAEDKPKVEKPAPPPSGSNSNVFMLNRPKAQQERASRPEPAAARTVQAPPPDPAPAASAVPAAESPSSSAETKTAETETVGAAAGPAKPRPVAQGASGNIFMLNRPKK